MQSIAKTASQHGDTLKFLQTFLTHIKPQRNVNLRCN